MLSCQTFSSNPQTNYKMQLDDRCSSEHDSEFALLHDDVQKLRRSRHPWQRCLPWIAHILSIILCCAILLYAKHVVNQTPQNCIATMHEYSPVLQAVDKYESVRFNGTINFSSPYKGPPTPEVIAAWNNLTNYGSLRVSASDIERAGASKDSVQYPASAGGGYPAISDGVHQQHCLYIIWQDHHLSFFPRKQASKTADAQRYEDHYEHCVDYLRQKLACNFDTGIVPFSWIKDLPYPLPNFSTKHKCVKQEEVKEWLLEKGTSGQSWENWPPPADAVREDEP